MMDMNFKDIYSLKPVWRIICEAGEAVNDKMRTIQTSTVCKVLAGALGAETGGAKSFAALYGPEIPYLSVEWVPTGLTPIFLLPKEKIERSGRGR